jgi:hypothetical protein
MTNPRRLTLFSLSLTVAGLAPSVTGCIERADIATEENDSGGPAPISQGTDSGAPSPKSPTSPTSPTSGEDSGRSKPVADSAAPSADAGNAGDAPASSNGRVILFGGNDESNNTFGDTRAWDGTSWTMLSNSGPGAQSEVAGSALGNSVVLFGGVDTAQTWIWNGTSWSLSSASGPTPRYNAMATTFDNQVLLFGGNSVNPSDPTLTYLWQWTARRGPRTRHSAPR